VIPLRSLRRIARELERASEEFLRHYPTEAQDWEGSDFDLETVRNLRAAEACIGAWISRRERKRRDPFLKGHSQRGEP